MKKYAEYLTVISIFLLLVHSTIREIFVGPHPSLIIPLQATIEWVVLFGLYLVIIYRIISLVWQNRKFAALKFFLGSLLLSYLILAPFELLWEIAVQPQTIFKWQNIFHPAIFSRVMPELAIFSTAGAIIGSVRQLLLRRQFIKLKKISLISGAIVTVGITLFASVYFFNLDYNGTEEIKFVNDEFNSLEELLNQPQFRDKVVYVDLWYSNCKPCIQQMPYLANIKKILAAQEIEYLYIARETSNPDSRQRWLNAIEKYDLQGWHAYMEGALQDKIWEPILASQPEAKSAAYPRYLLVNRRGKIVNYNATYPIHSEIALQEVQKVLAN
jgi:thiol-disulfide isomerase/thioredoxin